jgi:predicted metal-dependent phosphoesterase TrpH
VAKVDLHTHSTASHDGSLTEADYRKMLDDGKLDCIAVTDHNTISFAKELNEKIGHQIIIGEEITTTDGEIIGLYLQEPIRPGMNAAETIAAIKAQEGLVYIPHPFETLRKGLKKEVLDRISLGIDIIEVHNGRAVFQNTSKLAEAWAAEHKRPRAASSDAHGWHGWGRTYTELETAPSRATIIDLLTRAALVVAAPGLRGILYPKFNRIRRRRDGA